MIEGPKGDETMPNIIHEVIDMDKKVRQEYDELMVKKVKLNEFFSFQRAQLLTQYSEQIGQDIEKRKTEKNERLKLEKQKTNKIYQQKTDEINLYFKQNFDEWVKEILSYCLEK